MGKRATPPSDSEGPIEPVDLREALEERYLAYALSTIMHRALPDVRDGLKPVHRRILYAMRQLRLDPEGEFRKCAKIVGDVMGNFHPHGDQAIYDALARLAQDFAVRYPLVDGQGNFGNIDGDNPAAERYTEARLTDVAARLLEGIDEDTVDFRPNYDGREQEPSCCRPPSPTCSPTARPASPSAWRPTSRRTMPTSSATRRCTSSSIPNATIEKLVELVPGPDFPTGGIIVEPREQILEAYKTGRGGFRLRARWNEGGYRARHLPDRRHRDPLPGAEGQAGRAHRRAAAARRSCRCSATCATSPPKTSASCSSRRAAPSIRCC